jgi:hypothetical protein
MLDQRIVYIGDVPDTTILKKNVDAFFGWIIGSVNCRSPKTKIIAFITRQAKLPANPRPYFLYPGFIDRINLHFHLEQFSFNQAPAENGQHLVFMEAPVFYRCEHIVIIEQAKFVKMFFNRRFELIVMKKEIQDR